MGQGTALNSLFIPATQAYVNSLFRIREGEVRIGERIGIVNSFEALASNIARFVLIGIPEDVGVRANYGIGGAHTAWEPTLRILLNTQDTEACSGADIIFLGAFNFEHWMDASEGMDAERMRSVVDNIDDVVYPIIESVVRAGKTPIVIGGGHNNAYPLLQGASYARKHSVNCINLDAHSDYRRIEGRHSGNPFRYAKRDGFLDKYAMVGLHRAYNSGAVLKDLASDPSLHFSFYEDIFLEEQLSFNDAVDSALRHTAGKPAGIELDLDCIKGVLSSAVTPSGIDVLQARQYLHHCMRKADVAYVHITEGAVRLRDGREDISTAKLIAYLIRDVITASK